MFEVLDRSPCTDIAADPTQAELIEEIAAREQEALISIAPARCLNGIRPLVVDAGFGVVKKYRYADELPPRLSKRGLREFFRDVKKVGWKKAFSSYAYNQAWVETYGSQRVAGTNFTGYTTAKTVIDSTALYTLPAGWWNVGRSIFVESTFGESHRSTATNDTMTFQIMQGTIVIFTTGAVNLTTTAHTTIPGWFRGWVTCRAVGSGTAANCIGQANIQGQGFGLAANAADNGAGTGNCLAPNTAPAVGTGFDSTVTNVLDFWVAQSVNSSANGIQIQQYCVYSVPPG